MATINFKEEVLKVYPDAYCRVDKYDNYHINSIYDEGVRSQYGYSLVSEDNAWQNAYNNILNQQQ